MINHISPASYYSVTAPSSLVSRQPTPEAVDALLFILPGIERSEIENFRCWAKQADLVHYVRGNGKRALHSHDFSKPVPGGLKPDAQIFISGHGEIKNGIHYLLIDKATEATAKSSTIMESVRRIPKSHSNEKTPMHGYTLHMITCSSPHLTKEITPDKILWMRGTFFMYGDEDSIDSKDALPCVALSLQYQGQYKKNSGSFDPLALFEVLASKRTACMSMGGGNLRSVITAQAPNGLSDIMRPLFSRQETTDAPIQIIPCISAPGSILKKLAQFESERIATVQESINPPDEQLTRLMIQFIQRNDIAALHSLLEKRPELIDACDYLGDSLLIWAIEKKSLPVFELLATQSNRIDSAGNNGQTPLHWAAIYNFLPAIDFLIIGNQRGLRASLNPQDMDGNTPLISALKKKECADAVTRLLDLGADTNMANQWGETPLMLAAEQGNVSLVAKILRTRPDVHAADEEGKTALQLARENGHELLAEHLMKVTEILDAIAAQQVHLSNQMQPGANGH